MIDPLLRRWPVLAFAASAVLLGAAHAFQTFGGLAPCTLCLWQRQVYWIALPIAAIAAAMSWMRWPRPVPGLVGIALTLTFAAGAAIAAYHAGAEWKFWPGPTTCSGTGGQVSAAGLSRLMGGEHVAAPRCDKAAWVFLGLSMAGWNGLISLILTLISGVWAMERMRGAETEAKL